jgi:ABC-type multidrug transport system fused ATPase/permease subunit
MNNYKNKLTVFVNDLFKVSKIIKIKKKKRKIVLIVIINNLLVALDIVIILYFSNLLSSVTNFQDQLITSLLEMTYLLPLFIFIRFYLIYIEKVVITSFQQQIEKSLKTNMLSKIFEKANFSTADAYFYVNELTRQVSSFYSVLSIFLGSFVQILAFLIYLSITNFEIVIIFFIGGVLLFIPTIYLTKLGRKYAHISYVQQQEISNEIEKVLDNMFLIKIVKRVNQEIISFTNNIDIYFSARLKDIKAGTLNSILPNFLTTFFLSIFVLVLNVSKYLTLDFIGILLRLFQALGNVNKNLHLVSAFHVYLEKLYNLEIDTNKSSVINKLKVDTSLNHAVVFKDVSFKYFNASENTFENLNLTIAKNKHTIITGPNGSGKSTLVGLVAGLLSPNNGNIKSFSSKMGYVSSTPLILKKTLKENILYGSNEKVEDETMIDLVRKFKLYENVDEIDLHKTISNKVLSMGQMQKISFIRALLGSKEILILDESTANLDISTQKFINNILQNLKMTIINSTHSEMGDIDYDHHIAIRFDGDKKFVEKII